MNYNPNNTKQTKPYFFKGGKVPKNYDGDPDWDYIGSLGLKRIKAGKALLDYEQKGEPIYDKDGAYLGPGANIAHHTELKKNLEANDKKETIARAKATKDYINKHPEKPNARIYAQQQMNGARAYATKMDNKQRARAYVDGYQGFSTSKNRELEARIKKNYTIVGGRGAKGGK